MSRAPEQNLNATGPRLLFFSGGSALSGLSRVLRDAPAESVHLVTPFDSGGSSAALRQAFNMPAVGDLRNRLLALADRDRDDRRAAARLLHHRLPRNLDPADLEELLESYCSGADVELAGLPEELRRPIREALKTFSDAMPDPFDLRGASLGNLAIVGMYLAAGRKMDVATERFGALVGARGTVRTIVDADLHLAARLASGDRIVGQHLLTGKEAPALTSPIEDLWLVDGLDGAQPGQASIDDTTRDLIASANLICFPMGSFYSSLIANLLPGGVGRAVRGACCPKLYIANTHRDLEETGLPVHRRVERLVDFLQRDLGDAPAIPATELVSTLVVDTAGGDYGEVLDLQPVRHRGIEIIDRGLLTDDSRPHLDPERLAALLLELAARSRGAGTA